LNKYISGYKQKDDQMEFSKKVLVFACAMYAITLIACIVSWFILREMPTELKGYATFLFGTLSGAYYGKSAYENKAKITKTSKGDED